MGESRMGVIDNIKEIADVLKKAGDIDLYRKIIHAEGEVIELTRQLRTFEERVAELESALKFSGTLTFKELYYLAEGDTVPYCPRCWEVDKRAVHMTNTNTNQFGAFYQCPQCKCAVTDKKRALAAAGGGTRRFGSSNSWME
jgi:phage terminase large subunit GpA-like protein